MEPTLRSPDLPNGTVVGGRYRIDQVLAEGGMGRVYLATHLELDDVRVLKVIGAVSDTLDDSLARFRREAKLSAKIPESTAVAPTPKAPLPHPPPRLPDEAPPARSVTASSIPAATPASLPAHQPEDRRGPRPPSAPPPTTSTQSAHGPPPDPDSPNSDGPDSNSDVGLFEDRK